MKTVGCVIALVAAAGLASSALAQTDTEPGNNTLAGADGLGLSPLQTRVNLASLGGPGGDVDFFSNTLLTGDTLVFMTTPLGTLPANFSGPDTVLGAFGPAGTLIGINDDAGSDAIGAGSVAPTRGSVMRHRAFGSGTHAFGVSGYADFNFDGIDDFSGLAHTESGQYVVTAARFPASLTVGGNFADSAGNGGIAGADSLNLTPFNAVVAVCDLVAGAGGDVDFFSVFMNPGDVLSALSTPLGSSTNFASPDTIMGLFTAGGVLVRTSDDAGSDISGGAVVGPTRGSALRYQATVSGLYYVAVTGYADFNFDGIDDFSGVPHTETGLYGLTASLIPVPSVGALLGIGLLAAARRRRS